MALRSRGRKQVIAMRYIFALLAIVVLTSSSALGIVVDGSTSDWDASLIHSTPNMTSTGGLQINTFGAAVVNGTFYAFMELSRPVSDFDRLYPGAYINADSSAATELLYNAGSSTTPNYIPISTAAPMLAGTDIILEWGYDARITSPTDKLTYYGLNDHHDEEISAANGAHVFASGGSVLEWSAPLSEIVGKLTLLTDSVTASTTWSVAIGGEGHIIDDGTSWGPDVGGPVSVAVPEPGTICLLAGAGLTLILMGLARLRRRS